MIKMYQFTGGAGIPSYSPFCVKLECFLRMSGIGYESVEIGGLHKAPKGKGPFIEENGRRIGDSSLIIDHLKQQYAINPDRWLSVDQHAVSLAFQSMIEDHLYWCLLYSRWMEPDNWPKLLRIFFSSLPPVMEHVVPYLVRKDVKSALWKHGMGRHTPEEIYQFGINDIEAISDYLNDKPFFFGEQVSVIDAVIFGTIGNILHSPFNSPMTDFARNRPNLTAHSQRMQETYFPELTMQKAA